jgi:D-amino peptidase
MKILISADMEGATGVTWPADVEPGTEQWQRCRRMFTSDVNAAIAGFFDGGADEVLVNEAHATMRNLLLEELDERAVMLTGRHKDLTMVEGIQHPDVAGVAFVGYHAGAGRDGVLAHTYLPNSITGVRVNGEPASEGRLNALVAAEYGVPVILVTGDDVTCEDAVTYAPQAQTAAVKDWVSRYSAVCRPPRVTAAAIRAAASRSVKLAGRAAEPARGLAPGTGAGTGLAPGTGTGTGTGTATVSVAATATGTRGYRVEVDVDAAQLAQAAAVVPTVERTGERSVAYTSGTARDMIRCFKAVTTLIAAAIEDAYG